MSQNNIKVFKLQSGEEIIAKVISRPRGKINIDQPMQIISEIVPDPYRMITKKMMYMADWLDSCSETTIALPKAFVVAELTPEDSVLLLYNKQLSKNKDKNAPALPPSSFSDMTEEEIKKIANDAAKKIDEALRLETPEGAGIPPLVGDELDPDILSSLAKMFNSSSHPDNDSAIQFSMKIPNNILKEWIETGFIDYIQCCIQEFTGCNFMDEIIEAEEQMKKEKKTKKGKSNKEKISKGNWKEPKEEEKKNPYFGNKLEDWSPFLKDYLSKRKPKKGKDDTK